MKQVNKMKKHIFYRISCVVFVLLIVLCSGTAALAGTFKYKHDPRDNPSAMADIIEDENAVYGFRPSESGSLKMYAFYDWSDADVVEQGRQDRIAYHSSIESMYEILEKMTAEGKSTEEIARAVSAKRNEIRLAAYENDPEELEEIKKRNLEKYGHEEGPLPEEIYEQNGKSWEAVISKAFSTNSGMDACLGLYDDYYSLYVSVGQVSERSTVEIGFQTLGIGMMVVIGILGLLMIILYILIPLFRKIAEGKNKKEKPAPAPAPVTTAAQNADDESDTVAAIIAAISAASGTAPTSLKVVSFKRLK